MEFVEPEDEPHTFRRPPSPDDRVWRHPSEMAAPRGPVRRQLWIVGIGAAVAAGLLSTGFVVVAATLLDQPRDGTGVNRSSLVPLSFLSDTTAGGNNVDVVAVAERVRPAIVQLKVVAARSGTGSGVFYRSDGSVLTNAHVVDGATSITVVLSNGRELPGRVVGADPSTDIAVVKVDGGPFPVAELGTSGGLKVGQQAIAIGSPLGLTGPPVTVGVLTALHRSVRARTGTRVLTDMVQTDTPIAAGSSGGALVDGAGRVVGISTVVAGGDAGADGSGFAIPVDMARFAAEQLIATGRVSLVWLGVEGNDLDAPTALDLHVDGGAAVERVMAGSPAEHAGLAARDVIVAVDGSPVTSLGMLVAAVRSHQPGDVLALDVVRDHERNAMSATVAERPLGS